jgi:outer membrane immunogenic protein
MFRKLLLSTVAVTAMVGSAYAADLPSRRAPPPMAYAPPVPIFTWTGLYVGINAGAAFRGNSNIVYPSSAFGGAVPLPGLSTNTSNNARFIGGGQVGYNWQINQFVLGVETDFQGLTRANNNLYGGYGSNGGAGYLGTVRGRLGVAMDRFLVYGTGGFAYGNTNSNNTVIGLNNFGAPAYFTNYSNNNIRVGYAVGAGVEYAFTPNWSVKVEYLFADLGRNNRTYLAPGGLSGFTVNNREQDHIIRAGLNYRFGWAGPGPVLARY